MTVHPTTAHPEVARDLSAARQRRLAAVCAIVFGAFIIWGAAFASPSLLHNAAHDSRHALGFACH